MTRSLSACKEEGKIKNPDKPWSRISELAAAKKARFMIHCGDQIYADIPFSPQPAQYMILDDHEITNNFDQDMTFNSQDHVAQRNAGLLGVSTQT
ncbi:hypothetical protein [Zooshikella sp. RANM57]|uniref:hypothetical protein n=1 Tax=Zooshikella sp. RANM57 TaxID=3425863 RepID=UPI003D6E3306